MKPKTDWEWYWRSQKFDRSDWWNDSQNAAQVSQAAAWYELLRRHPLVGKAVVTPRAHNWDAVPDGDLLNFSKLPWRPTTWEYLRATLFESEALGVDLANLLSVFGRKTWLSLPQVQQWLFQEVLSHYSFNKGLSPTPRLTLLEPKTIRSLSKRAELAGAAAYHASMAGKLVFVVDRETESPDRVVTAFSKLYRKWAEQQPQRKIRWRSWLKTISQYEQSEEKRRSSPAKGPQREKKHENQRLRVAFQKLFSGVAF